MYVYELLIGTRIKLSEDVNVYYNIEGIHAPLYTAQKASDKKHTLKAAIKKLIDNYAA